MPRGVDFHGDALPANAIARIGSVAFYQIDGDHIAYSGNGKILASGGSKIFLWDPETGRELGQFEGFRLATASRGFALSSDGALLFAASTIYETRTGKEQCKLEKAMGEVFHAAFSPAGKLAAAGTRAGHLGLWDTTTGKEVHSLAQNGNPVWTIAFSPDGEVLFSGENWSTDLATRLWDVATGKEFKHFPGQALMALSADGEVMATCGEKRHSLNLVAWRTGKTLVTIKEFPGRGPNGVKEGIQRDLTSACFSPDGKVIATTCRFDAAIRLWDAGTGKEVRMIPLVANSYCVVFSPDGKTLAVGTPWGLDKLRIRMFNPQTGEEQLLPEQMDEVYEARFLPDGKSLLTTSADKKLRLWQSTGGKVTRTVDLGKRPRAIAPDGSLVAVSGQPESSSFPADKDREKTVDLCDAATGKVMHQLKHDNNVERVAWAADGTAVAVATGRTFTDRAEVYIWDTATGKLRKRWAAAAKWSMVFSPDGKTLATGDEDFTVELWQTSNGQILRTFGTPVDPDANQGRRFARITSIAFSPDGKRIAGASMFQRNDITVWETSSGREVCRCADKPDMNFRGLGWVKALVFSADGSTLFSGSEARSIRVWDTATGKECARLPGHRGDILSLTLSAENTRLASASKDGTVLIWDLNSIGGTQKGKKGHP